MENEFFLPIREKYNFFVCLSLIVISLGLIPMAFCRGLEGFFLVYFIVYLVLVAILILLICIFYPVVRNQEIKFFKNKFSIENMEKTRIYKFKKEDCRFHTSSGDIELTRTEVKDLTKKISYPYDSFNIYATYQCNFAGEVYKIFINFESENTIFSLKLDNVLYSLIRLYKINVDNLDKVLTQCEDNLKGFFKSKEQRQQAQERNAIKEFNELVEPILELCGSKAFCSDAVLFVNYHDNFKIKYAFAEQTMYINDKYFYSVEEQDLLDFLTEISDDMYYIIEFKNKRFSSTPYFKLLNKSKTTIDKMKNYKNILRVFDINRTFL